MKIFLETTKPTLIYIYIRITSQQLYRTAFDHRNYFKFQRLTIYLILEHQNKSLIQYLQSHTEDGVRYLINQYMVVGSHIKIGPSSR